MSAVHACARAHTHADARACMHAPTLCPGVGPPGCACVGSCGPRVRAPGARTWASSSLQAPGQASGPGLRAASPRFRA
eukprot:15445186-Alexandrium_andersonii.AAC.1